MNKLLKTITKTANGVTLIAEIVTFGCNMVFIKKKLDENKKKKHI